jgi:uncharacterized membrane protein YqjE
MDESTVNLKQLAAASTRVARQLLIIVENRLELLTVEAQEERERAMRAFLSALGVAVFGLLAGMALTAAIVMALWAFSPVASLLIAALLHSMAGIWLWRRLARLLRDWKTLPATLDQLRKDRACLEKLAE